MTSAHLVRSQQLKTRLLKITKQMMLQIVMLSVAALNTMVWNANVWAEEGTTPQKPGQSQPLPVPSLSALPKKATPRAVYFGLSSEDLAAILKKTKLDYEESQDDWSDPQFFIYLDNRQEVVVWTYGCENKKCQDLRLWTYFPRNGRDPDYARVNYWNSEQRWTKAYFDQDRDAVLEMDFDADGGVTEDAVINLLEIYVTQIYEFVNFMNSHPLPEPTSLPSPPKQGSERP